MPNSCQSKLNVLTWINEPSSYHIINLEDAANRLCGQGQRTDGNQQRLDHQLLHDVGDSSLLNIKK